MHAGRGGVFVLAILFGVFAPGVRAQDEPSSAPPEQNRAEQSQAPQAQAPTTSEPAASPSDSPKDHQEGAAPDTPSPGPSDNAAAPSPPSSAPSDNPTAPAAPPPAAAAPPSTPPATQATLDKSLIQGVLGKDVRSATGEDMGRIVDVIVDWSGQTRAAIIDFGGFLGVGSRRIAVDWNALHFSPDDKGSQITLDLTRDQVKSAPEYKEGKQVVVLGASGNTETMPDN